MGSTLRTDATTFRLARLEGLFAVEWVGAPTAGDVDTVVDSLTSEAALRGRPRDFVVIVSKHATMPDHEARLAYLRNAERTMQYCDRMHIVLDGMPFINAFARGLVTTASVVARFRGRVKVHDTLASCTVELGSSRGRGPAEMERTLTDAFA